MKGREGKALSCTLVNKERKKTFPINLPAGEKAGGERQEKERKAGKDLTCLRLNYDLLAQGSLSRGQGP